MLDFLGTQIYHPAMSQICTIGERSGDLSGQGRVLRARRRSREMRSVWSLALSCWKLAPDEVPLGVCRMISTYHGAVKDVWRMTRDNLLLYKIAPNTVTLGVMAAFLCKTKAD
ncbi:hypothetical protein TNCV_4045281 [Trichonephila clavipes]|nr:hypothetical protein TNCV_4045281 [Trichonephila clavipes]